MIKDDHYKTREEHFKVIKSFLEYLNSKSDDYILKGGTALMLCYNLDRFSEDIDLDSSNHEEIKYIIESFCKKYDYIVPVPRKETNTVLKYYLHYNDNYNPLKIEVSFRNYSNNNYKTTKIKGICVYDLDSIAFQKATAYKERYRIRDTYDVCFLVNNYFQEMSEDTINYIRQVVLNKGMDEIEIILKEQKDDFINEDLLIENFLNMLDQLNLLDIDKEDTEDLVL